LALGTGLGTIAESRNVASKITREIDDKIDSKNSLSPLRHFTEHLVGVFVKLLQENDLDHESSRLLIRWLKSTAGIQPATIHTEKCNKNTIDS
jgi:hypothetical protein